jgi:hypothetical protein
MRYVICTELAWIGVILYGTQRFCLLIIRLLCLLSYSIAPNPIHTRSFALQK